MLNGVLSQKLIITLASFAGTIEKQNFKIIIIRTKLINKGELIIFSF